MRGLGAPGLCALLAGIVGALLQSSGRLRRREPPASVDTALLERNDMVFMLQANAAVKLAEAKKQAARRKSANLAEAGTATRSPGVPAVSSNLVPTTELEMMTTAGSDDTGGWQSKRSSVSFLEMLRTKADNALRVRQGSDAEFVGYVSLDIYYAIGVVFLGLTVFLTRWANSYSKHHLRKNEHVEEPCVTSIKERILPPSQEAVSLLDGPPIPPEQASPPCEECFSLPMSALRQGSAIVQGDSEVVILGKSGDTRLHVTMSKMIDGTRIKVSTLQDKSGQSVTIGPPPNTSPANARSLEIHGQSTALGISAFFEGTLEEQSPESYTVFKDQQLVMYLRAGPNANQVTVTTGHGKVLASVSCGGVGSNAEDDLEMRVDESADPIIVLTCALAVVIRLLV